MKIAVCSVAYNEERYIGACINNWKGVADHHLVLISSKPWNGSPVEADRTYLISRKLGAETIIGEWKTEADQRTWGLARLYDYDYVLIVDPDELYTKADQEKILQRLRNPIDFSYEQHRNVPAFRLGKMKTFWKTHEYVFNPADNHKPVIAVDPKQLYCHEHRQFKYMSNDRNYLDYAPVLDITCYHMSWAKSDAKVKEKIQSFSHSDWINHDWYNNVWLKWEPGSPMLVRAYGEENSTAIYDPAPQEIIDLIRQ